MKNVILGCEVTDRITGFKGTVTGLVKYISGCDQALVAPRLEDSSKLPESTWIDLNRLDVSDKAPIELDLSKDRGACEAPPKR